MPTTDPSSLARSVTESQVPLASSILWNWMRHYYSHQGLCAWTGGDIPFHITNTPLLAREWAKTIFSLLRDFHRQGLLTPDHPIEVTELGPGTGRHAFFLLRELEKLEVDSKVFHPLGYRFVLKLAELGVKGIESLAAHPQLQPYIKRDRLRLSLFDITSQAFPLAWPTLTPEQDPSPNPVFIIANYVIDSLPYEVIRLKEGTSSLGLVSTQVRGLEPDLPPELSEHIELNFHFPAEPAHFSRADWNDVLGDHLSLEPTHLPFPTTAMTLLEHLRQWSTRAACLFVADKCFVESGQLTGLEEPELVPHGGSFSFNANTYTLGRLAERWGGLALHTTPRDGTLDLSHIIVSPPSSPLTDSWPELNRRIAELEDFHAVDRFRIGESIDAAITKPTLRMTIDLIRLSGNDPQVLYEVSDHVLRALDEEEADSESQAELRRLLGPCLDAFFPIGDEADLAFEVGRIAYRLEMYRLSERAFSTSLNLFGDDAPTHFNLGLGWYYEHRLEQAESAFRRALLADPNYKEAKTWLNKVAKTQTFLSEATADLAIL